MNPVSACGFPFSVSGEAQSRRFVPNSEFSFSEVFSERRHFYRESIRGLDVPDSDSGGVKTKRNNPDSANRTKRITAVYMEIRSPETPFGRNPAKKFVSENPTSKKKGPRKKFVVIFQKFPQSFFLQSAIPILPCLILYNTYMLQTGIGITMVWRASRILDKNCSKQVFVAFVLTPPG
jgi:hypothetical protein